MSHDRTGRSRANARAFRPSLDGYRLEPRQLLSTTVAALPKNQFLLTHPQPGFAKTLNDPVQLTQHTPPFGGPVYNHGVADVETARGGASAIVAAPDGSRFRISLALADNQYDGGLSAETGSSGTNVVPSNVTQPIGTIRVYADARRAGRHHRRRLDPVPAAHDRPAPGRPAQGLRPQLRLRRRPAAPTSSTSARSRSTAARSRRSSGSTRPTSPARLTIGGTGTVDRIAFNSLLPGAAIGVGGTLNTLDIANAATPDGRAGHQHRPRPEPAQRRRRPHPVQRRQLLRRPRPRPDAPAAQGDGHRVEHPQRQHPLVDHRDQHRHPQPLRLGLHPGQRHHRPGERVHRRPQGRQRVLRPGQPAPAPTRFHATGTSTSPIAEPRLQPGTACQPREPSKHCRQLRIRVHPRDDHGLTAAVSGPPNRHGPRPGEPLARPGAACVRSKRTGHRLGVSS